MRPWVPGWFGLAKPTLKLFGKQDICEEAISKGRKGWMQGWAEGEVELYDAEPTKLQATTAIWGR